MLVINKRMQLSRAVVAIANQPIVEIKASVPPTVPTGFTGKYYVLPLLARGSDSLSSLGLETDLAIVRDGPVFPQSIISGDYSASYIRLDGEYDLGVGGQIPRMFFWQPMPAAHRPASLEWTLRGRIPSAVSPIEAAPMFLLIPVECAAVTTYTGAVTVARGAWDVDPTTSFPSLAGGEGLRVESLPVVALGDNDSDRAPVLLTGRVYCAPDSQINRNVMMFEGFAALKGQSSAVPVTVTLSAQLVSSKMLYLPNPVDRLKDGFAEEDFTLENLPHSIGGGGGSGSEPVPDFVLSSGTKVYSTSVLRYMSAASYGGVYVDDASTPDILTAADLEPLAAWILNHPAQVRVTYQQAGSTVTVNVRVIPLADLVAIVPIGSGADIRKMKIFGKNVSRSVPTVREACEIAACSGEFSVTFQPTNASGTLLCECRLYSQYGTYYVVSSSPMATETAGSWSKVITSDDQRAAVILALSRGAVSPNVMSLGGLKATMPWALKTSHGGSGNVWVSENHSSASWGGYYVDFEIEPESLEAAIYCKED